jgi:hypothetical protein
MNLDEMVNRVNSKESFLQFVRALADDAAAADKEEKYSLDGKLNLSPRGWENGTIANFLDAMEAWTRDGSHIPEAASWRSLAQILHSGKFYE